MDPDRQTFDVQMDESGELYGRHIFSKAKTFVNLHVKAQDRDAILGHMKRMADTVRPIN